jgi:homoserine dehydrogenase
MSRQELTIGLFGFGCVGTGLYEVLAQTPTLKTTLKTVCIKHPHKPRKAPDHLFTTDPGAILNDPDINVVVELIDDADAAYALVKAALLSGKAVVTANKKMLAEHLEEFLAIQASTGVPLLYEAACCASIPIIRNLEEYYDNDLLDSIQGIVNGSTNYILTRALEEHLSMPEALAQAQAMGYAESNPILDTGGFDAKYKLVILLAHAFGLVVQPEEVFHCGIDQIGELEWDYARAHNLKIKLVAHAYKTPNGSISAFVLPTFVRPDNKLFGVDDVFNGVVTQTCFADTQFFMGKGAGAYPTASAVLSDLSALTYHYRYEHKKYNAAERLTPAADIQLKVFLRHDLAHSTEFKRHFESIEACFTNRDAGYLIGIITLEALQWLIGQPVASLSPIVLEVLHPAVIEAAQPQRAADAAVPV